MVGDWKNQLWFGDNLDILRNHVPTQSVDLIYLDPPFNSKADYNVLFKTTAGEGNAAQTTAFKDTWEWDENAAEAYHELQTSDRVPQNLKNLMQALKVFLTGDTGKKGNSMMAYLTMMALRLVELHRVLRPTGSLYLHCDPTASHYIKLVLDAIFEFRGFRNEIVWLRSTPKGLTSRRLPSNHDVLFLYVKGEDATWNAEALITAYDLDNLSVKTDEKYSQTDDDGRRYQLTSLINPNSNRPNLTYEFLGVTRVWRWSKERMQAAYDAGLIVQPKPGGVPRYKRYLDTQRGQPLADVWVDIPPLNSQAQERLGYPTQKPESLLERIITASSNEGDIVLDPFCGCGTTIAVAERLKRKWIGIDVTTVAVDLMERRLIDMFSGGKQLSHISDFPVQKRRLAMKRYFETGVDEMQLGIRLGLRPYEVRGVPETVEDARFLFQNDPFQFEYWAVIMVGSHPREKKGADRGIDGVIQFQDRKLEYKRALVSVKGGQNIKREMIATLKGDMAREGAIAGVLVTLEEPTKAMRQEAADAGRWNSDLHENRSFPVIQILTVADILGGKFPDLPRWGLDTFRKATKAKPAESGQIVMEDLAEYASGTDIGDGAIADE